MIGHRESWLAYLRQDIEEQLIRVAVVTQVLRFIYMQGLLLNGQPSLVTTLTRAHTCISNPILHAKGKTERVAARKIKISFQNNTQHTLDWLDSGVRRGERSVVAPDQLNFCDTGNWALESDGFAIECE